MKLEAVRVVMIDDDEDDFAIVKGLLERQTYNFYQPVWVGKYEEGLQRLRAQDGDIFLIDYNLGEKTGLKLLEEAGAKDLRKPVIMLTGIESPEVDLSAMEAGATYYMQKGSLGIDHLLERTIRYAIKRAKDYEEIRQLDRLRAERDAAEAASEAKNLFLANISHELRTPLNAIIGFADLAVSSTDRMENLRFNSVIRRNARHLLALVNDLLDLTKIEAGKYEADIADCDWRGVVRDVMQTLEPSADQKGNALTFSDDRQIPKFIKTDAHWFRQILVNLVGNAIKFTDKGSINLRVEKGTPFRLFVSDSGQGMSEADQQRIFKPFTQGENGCQRKYGGTGLGLHLSRQVAELLGGSLDLVTSRPGVGTTFCLSLPCVWDKLSQTYPNG